MTHLAISLLGPFQAVLGGRTVEGLHSERLRALLAYLAVTAREHQREQVAALLWPERPDAQALGALRFALSNLREALGDRRTPTPFLIVTRTTVQFNPASDHWLDVAEFQGLVDRQDAPGLERAVSLYHGPFLDGLSVDESPAFEDWVLLTGEELQRCALSALGRLTGLQIERGAVVEAARWARRQIELEPYREHAHRQLMTALALGGERSAALAHYEAWRRLLADELGCEPEDETRALFAQIRQGPMLRPRPVPAGPEALRPASARGDAGRTHFVARAQELARLGTLLDQALLGQGGVALVAGEAGSGKTALLDEFARRAGEERGDLIALRGRCNAYAGSGDPYLPFREILQTLAGDVEGKRAGGTLSSEQARRVWDALPSVGEALVEQGPDLIDSLVPGEALLQRAEAFAGPAGASGWLARLREAARDVEGGAKAARQPDLFAQVTQVLHTIASRAPLLLAIDDLQWADTGTVALLFHLGRRLSGSRILLACAYRPEVWNGGEREHVEAQSAGAVLQELIREWGDILIDLDLADGRAFVEQYVDSEPNRLGVGFRRALYDHTEGNPLFTAELLRCFEREGALVRDEVGRWTEGAEPEWERCPPQVEAVIGSHMDSLSDEDRSLLQAASVQGEQFAAEVVARVLGLSEEAIVRRLSGHLKTRHRLVQAVSLDRLASTGQRLSTYRFAHTLFQEYLYSHLDPVERAHWHEATGRALQAVHGQVKGQPTGERLQAQAPELARHYEAAGMPLEAVRWRLEAGQWAAQLVAFDEAIAHLERGLALVEGADASGERLRMELGLRMAMVEPVLLRGGWQAPELATTLKRLADLVEHPRLQGDPLRVEALSTLALQITWLADPQRGLQVGQQLMAVARGGDAQYLTLAHWALGNGYWSQGQFAPAREHLQRALALYDPEAGPPLSPVIGADPLVAGLTMLGAAEWFLGYPDQGRDSLRQACEVAGAIDHPPTAAFANVLAALIYALLGRDSPAVQAHLAAFKPLGTSGDLVYNDFGQMLAAQVGSACTQVDCAAHVAPSSGLGHSASPAEESGSFRDFGGLGMGRACLFLLQAGSFARAGLAEMALQIANRAIAWMDGTGVRAMEAEAWRMRGELLLRADGAREDTRPRTTDEGQSGDDETKAASSAVHRPSSCGEAEACFQRALEIARAREIRWIELRVAVSLARIWQAQGRRDEACELVSTIYSWFTEGFDTVDLVEAKALLGELE